MSYIGLQDARTFDFMNPVPDNLKIEDIANALSKLCRFTGHTNRFYSVAEHSVRVSRMVPDMYARAGLMHDAAEAFIGDVSTPLKRLIPEYRIVERRVWEAVSKRFNLGEPTPGLVKEADHQIVVNEAWAFGLDPSGWEGFPAPNMKQIVELSAQGGWDSRFAAHMFLARAKELGIE